MLRSGSVCSVAAVLFLAFVASYARANYEYSRTIGSYWDLSVRASTLDAKADYLNRFIATVDSAHLEGHNAVFFPTPENSVEGNIAVLKTLQKRMAEIRGMDVTSFAYQQAISQITAQEQDKAHALLGVIEGRWFLTHHPLLWDWIGIGLGVLLFAIADVSFLIWAEV